VRNFTIVTAGEFASIEDIINAYRNFVGNSAWWKKKSSKTLHRFWGNIEVAVRMIGSEDINWIQLAHHTI
jgi:hypothetical protein